MEITVNYLAVVAAAVANMVVGMVWYSPKAFGAKWMRLVGKTPADLEKAKPQTGSMYALAALGSLVMSFVLSHFVYLLQVTDFGGAFQLAAWAWLGFIATTTLNQITWIGRPKPLWLLDNGYYLVTLTIMASILAYWR